MVNDVKTTTKDDLVDAVYKSVGFDRVWSHEIVEVILETIRERLEQGDTSLSRLARSTADTLAISDQLQKRSVDLVSLSEKIDTTSAAGKMVFRMLAVLAEFERDQISERTTTAMQHKRSKRELVGAVPYGFSLGADHKQLVTNDEEQSIIRTIRKSRADGATLQAIANRLTEMGHKPRGKAWYPKTISNILNTKAA